MAELAFLFDPEVREVFDRYSRLLGIRIAFFDPAGRMLLVGEDRGNCDYCRALRADPRWDARCHALDAKMRRVAVEKGESIYRCHGGMTEAVIPVRDGTETLGFAMIGQFRTGARMPGELARKRPADRARLAAAFARTPFHSPASTADAIGLFASLVRSFSARRLIRAPGRHRLASLLDRLRGRPEETLRLADAAALLHRSSSTAAQLFRKATGMGLRRWQVRERLERAEEMLRNARGRTIREIAFELGFRDPLYFSRLFRKHKGRSPREVLRGG